MSIQLEFSKHAEGYARYSIIQGAVIRKLLNDLGGMQPRSILDLGCGSGALYNALSWQPDAFLGIDFAPRMLELHPKAEQIQCVYGDFDDPHLFERLRSLRFDRIFSASALQWAQDLDAVMARIAAMHTPVSLAIFTAGTFAALLKTAGLKPLLRTSEEVAALAKRYFHAEVETVHYTLAFDSTREMLRYIKRSGVSGRRNALSVGQTKRLMEEYPLGYLEFEVVFIRS